jgi:protein-disulfide isomerase-like protein with CxxC motif
LQQLMAGARKFRTDRIARKDIFSANRETEKETGVPFMTDVDDQLAKKILKG